MEKKTSEIQILEDELKNNNLTFEQKIKLKDKLLNLELKIGIKTRGKYTISCINCSA